MKPQLAEFQCFLQMFPALLHERIVGQNLDTEGLDLHQLGKDARGTVEQRARQHRTLDALALRIRFLAVGAARFVEASTRHVQPVLGVIEESARERGDEFLLGVERIGGNGIGLDPVAVVMNALLAIDDTFGAERNRAVHDAGRTPGCRAICSNLHRLKSFVQCSTPHNAGDGAPYRAVDPPSTGSAAPVIDRPASLQRSTASAPISSGSTKRLLGCAARITSRMT